MQLCAAESLIVESVGRGMELLTSIKWKLPCIEYVSCASDCAKEANSQKSLMAHLLFTATQDWLEAFILHCTAKWLPRSLPTSRTMNLVRGVCPLLLLVPSLPYAWITLNSKTSLRGAGLKLPTISWLQPGL